MATKNVDNEQSPFNVLEHPAKEAFLTAYVNCASITRAAEQCGISRITHYNWYHGDSEYAALFDGKAKRMATDTLVDEAIRRAHEGVEEPVFYQGQEVSTVRKYSDTLLIFKLKQLDPSYREVTKHEHTGKDGEPLKFTMNIGATNP